jgi:hypothetical protein
MTDPLGGDRLSSLDRLAAQLSMEGTDDFDEMASPFFWPGLAAPEWESLRLWVERFRARFPHATRIPDCWYHHVDLVEALSALRDHERASYSSTAPPTAGVEWHRAFRDMESRYEAWIKRFKCQGEPGRPHLRAAVDERPREDWADFVQLDTHLRADRQIKAAMSQS